MNTIETYRGVVYPHQLDHMGHMNVQWYTAKFDEATWHLFAAIGITPSYIRGQNKGMAAIAQFTRYNAEVMPGELLLVNSKVIEVGQKTIKFLHLMQNVETMQEVASTELLAVHLDREIRKSCALPRQVIENCKQLFDITS